MGLEKVSVRPNNSTLWPPNYPTDGVCYTHTQNLWQSPSASGEPAMDYDELVAKVIDLLAGCMAGLPRGLTRRICKRRRRC